METSGNRNLITTKTENMASLKPEKDPLPLTPRGSKTMLPHGGLPEVFSIYLANLIKQTGGVTGPIGKQFVAQTGKEKRNYNKKHMDPLAEDEHEVAPGLVYKYEGKISGDGKIINFGRALWTITRFCGTYCRFCTRGREVGIPPNVKGYNRSTISRNPFLTDKEISQVFEFVKVHRELNEVIISGGDPLTAPQGYLTRIIEGLVELQKSGHLDIIRVGTRLPVHNPASIREWHYELLGKIKNPHLMLHINHPAELTPQTIEVLNNFRKISLALVHSQTVMLKGVNDDVQTLHDLFAKMTTEGIIPYYIYQNDPVYWAEHFTVPFKRAIKIWGELRPKLSGIAATARFAIDTPFGFGKVPVPEGNSWKFDTETFKDFKGNPHKIS